jgi:hypothetical protein
MSSACLPACQLGFPLLWPCNANGCFSLLNFRLSVNKPVMDITDHPQTTHRPVTDQSQTTNQPVSHFAKVSRCFCLQSLYTITLPSQCSAGGKPFCIENFLSTAFTVGAIAFLTEKRLCSTSTVGAIKLFSSIVHCGCKSKRPHCGCHSERYHCGCNSERYHCGCKSNTSHCGCKSNTSHCGCKSKRPHCGCKLLFVEKRLSTAFTVGYNRILALGEKI